MILLGIAAHPLWLSAQTTEPSGPAATTSPSTFPAVAEAHGEVRVPASRPATTQISLNFKDASVDAVLEYLSDIAGFVVVKESPVSGRVTMLSKQPVSPSEAVVLLNAVLANNGYSAIQMGRILKITAREKAKKSNIPVQFGADPSAIAETDELITQVIPVRSVDAVKLKTDLQPLVGTDADLSSNGGSNTIIITDTSANIRRVVQIVANLDKRDATENTINVRQLKYADATAAAKLITDIFKPADQQGGQGQSGIPPQFQMFRAFGGGGFPGGGGRGGAPAAQPQADQGRTGRVVASSDQRTNTIVVTGPADTLKVIDEMLLDKLDANPAAEQAFFFYALKNGQAKKMEAVLNGLFGTSSTSGTGSRANTSQAGNRVSGAGGSSGQSSFSRGTGNTGRTGGSGAMSFGGNTQINRNAQSVGGVPTNVSAAASDLAGQVFVVADEDTNSLLVSTASKYQDRVREIILQLDRPVPQVLIKVLIAEVTHDNSDDIGVDFSVLNLRASGNGQRAGTNFPPPVAGGLVVSVLETNLTATIRALATAGKLDVLSRPYILASDNQLATITVGQEVPIITDSRLDQNNNPINQIQYRDIGIILNVTPHINPDGQVIVDVSPEVSSFSDRTVPISSTVSAPVFNLRSADSRVGIRDGETIVIGGLMEDRKTQTISKVPFLGDIPGLGLLFKRNQLTKTKTELLFFLTPHVAKAPDRLAPMSQDELRGTKLTPNAVEPGMFDEHMRGLERGGATSQPQDSPQDSPQRRGDRGE